MLLEKLSETRNAIRAAVAIAIKYNNTYLR